MMRNITFVLLLAASVMPPIDALSENFQITGKIDAWQDGQVSMRAIGEGVMDFGAERYAGGMSSGLNISNGSARYSFRSADYAIRLDDFAGSIITESDTKGTTVDGNGNGSIRTFLYENSSMGALMMGFPSGELYGQGVWTIKASSARAIAPIGAMDTNESESNPVKVT
jgi:hypothetical protein